MPYSGSEDTTLPENVKRLNIQQRKKWVATFNNTIESCQKNGGKADKCEELAFRIANGTVKKEAGAMEEIKEKVKVDEPVNKEPEKAKYIACETGATSFEEVEVIKAAQEQAEQMQETTCIAEGLMGNVLRSQDIPPGEKPGRLQRVIDGLVKRLGLAGAEKQVIKTDDGQKGNLRQQVNPGTDYLAVFPKIESKRNPTFLITKDKAGNMRWLGIPTNKWRDRDTPPQIIEEKAHLEFAGYLNKTKDFPILLSWHTPGTRIGIADWVDYSNGFLMMGGTIDKDKYNEAEKLREKCLTEDIGMSHGFVYSYSDKEKEIIGKYRTWEVSHLPAFNAANVWTSFDIIKKEGKTVLNPEKRKYLVELHGEDIVSGLERKAAELEKDLTSAGIDFKEFSPVDTKEVVTQATKAVIESDGFVTLIASVASLAEKVKALSETAIPAMQKSIDDVKKVADEAEAKAKKSIDDIVAEAMTAKSTAFRASQDGKGLTEEEKKKDQTHEIKVIEPSMAQGFLGKKTA